MESVKLIENVMTWQGEGPDTGQRMLLLRFKRCNKKCSWCDTLVKMRVCQEAEYKIENIQDLIKKENLGLMITGGEPTLKGHQFDSTKWMLNNLDYPLANVETNGFGMEQLINGIFPNKKNIKLIYSPKMFSQKDLEEEIERTRGVHSDPRVFFKVVYEKDNDFIIQYLEMLSELSVSRRVFLMPKGSNRADLLRTSIETFDACEELNFNFSSRTHLIYDFV